MASGGEGDLPLTRHRPTGELRVVKIYRGDRRRDAEALSILAKADPAHVVVIHDSGQHGGRWWEAMDYCEHGSLSELIACEGLKLSPPLGSRRKLLPGRCRVLTEGVAMSFLRRSQPPKEPDAVYAQIEIMRDETAANERDNRGLQNRPRYTKARDTLIGMGAEAVPTLIEALQQSLDANEEKHQLPADIVNLLGKIGDPRAIEPLSSLLHGSMPTFAAVALGTIGSPDAKAVLLGALETEELREYAAKGLAFTRSGDPEIVTALLRATDDTRYWVAGAAIHALAELRATAATEKLTLLAENADEDRVRAAARSALAQLGA